MFLEKKVAQVRRLIWQYTPPRCTLLNFLWNLFWTWWVPPSIPKASYSGDPKIHLPSMLWHYVSMPFLIPETCFSTLNFSFLEKIHPPRLLFRKSLFLSKIVAQVRRLIFIHEYLLIYIHIYIYIYINIYMYKYIYIY